MNELSIHLDATIKIPLYEQIYQHIKKAIVEGQLKALEKLPSTRALSAHLQVSRSTVDLAYEQLLSEGYIESIPCKGYYICEIEGLFQLSLTNVKHLVPVIKEKKYDYDFSPNGIDLTNFPYHIWRKITRNILYDDNQELFLLGSPSGERKLRDTIVSYLYHARGVKCTADQMIIGAGNDYLMMLISQIIGTDHKIAIENPTYKKAYGLLQNLGYEMETVDMDEQGMSVSQLKSTGANIAYVMPSHQYPIGMIMPIKRRMELLKWASEKEGRYIIEDDYDSEFRYKGKPIPSLQGSDTKGNVIYLGTFSKSVAPSIRISYMVLPPSMLKIYETKKHIFSSTVSKTDQMVMDAFIEEGYFERHLNKMRGIYKGKHDVILREVRKIKSVEEILGENAGVHILVRFKEGYGEDEMIERAKNVGVKVYGLSDYDIQPQRKGKDHATVILGYANLSEEEISAAMIRLKQVW